MTGRLVLVGTPIGNLGDLSPRAVAALTEAEVIACEDTRRTGRLLTHLGIASPGYVVVNEHTEGEAVDRLLGHIADGATVVLVSDAGMPAVSDPGEHLVARAIDAGVDVEVVPGPSAVLHALVLSGLTTSRFVFEGFLPRKGGERSRRIAEVVAERRTVVLFEAPHRLARTLEDLCTACGPERRVVLARELTKLHEEIWRGTLADALTHIDAAGTRGEYVVVLGGAPAPAEITDDELVVALHAAKAQGLSTRDAVDAVATSTGAARRRVYDLALSDRESDTTGTSG